MTWAYLYTFTQTCVLEFPFYAWFMGLRKGRWQKTICAVVALNAFTHPIVFFGFMSIKAPLVQNIALAEFFAFGFEAWACFYFLGLSKGRALAAATSANLFSWQLGPILTYWIFF